MSEPSSAKIAAPQNSTPTATTAASSKPAITPVRSALLQRACACGELPGSGGKCDVCDKKNQKNVLQRASSGGAQPTSVPPSVNQVLGSPGRPLDNSTRTFMESRFGRDFSRVRIHDDSLAAESARSVNASAYTIGQHIAFAGGQYRPSHPAGAALLAHELTHTVQQEGLQYSPAGTSPVISSEHDSSEQEAAAVAAAVMRGDNVSLSARSSSPVLHRTPWGKCPAGTKKTLNVAFGEELKKKRVAGGAKAAEDKTPGYFTYEAAEAAEDRMAEYFKTAVGRYAHTNKQPLSPTEDADPFTQPEQYMINQAYADFRSGGSSRKKKPATSGPPPPPKYPRNETIPVPPETFEEGNLEEAFAANKGPEGAQMKPDFVDFGKSEVYDATTIDGAKDKVNKIKGYVELYENIRIREKVAIGVPVWKAGTELPPPTKFTFGLPNDRDPIKICFGVTDFDLYPGVLAYQIVDTSDAKGDMAAEGAPSEAYEISLGGSLVTLYALPAPSDTDLLNSGPDNKAIAESIPGVILKTLHRKKKGQQETIDAEIETTQQSKSGHQSALPLKTTGGKAQVVYNVNRQSRKLTLKSKSVNIPVEYEKLSKGVITKLNYSEETGLSGEGKITPSIPLLKGLDLRFAFAQDSLEVISKLPGDKLKVPIPGFKVKKADISLQLAPEFKPSGTIIFTIGTGKRALLEGVISVTADEQGFLATGNVVAHIPGVDEAKGDVSYRPATGWEGSFTITKSGISFVENASVTVAFSDKGLDIDGGLDIVLPGKQRATLRVKKRSATSWVYIGKGVFNVPRLKPISIDFEYDGDNVVGEAKTGFTFSGLKGDIELAYVNGVITGKGKLKVDKGRATGSIDVTLNKNRKFSGTGNISYQVTENLVATGGIQIDEEKDPPVTLMGALEFAKPIPLFQPVKGDYEIFSVNLPIPVPGASIAGVGININIRGALSAGYQIGPAELQNTKLEGTFNPLDEDPDFKIKGHTRLYIGASAYITGSISGEVELDIGVAEAAGGLKFSATAQLKGYAASNLDIFFSKNRFEVSGDFEVLMKLLLILALSAYVRAEAGVWKFKVSTRKDWILKQFTYDPGLQLGMKLKKPIRYASDQQFVPPSLGDIEWITPKLNAEDAMSKAFGGSDAKEVEE